MLHYHKAKNLVWLFPNLYLISEDTSSVASGFNTVLNLDYRKHLHFVAVC